MPKQILTQKYLKECLHYDPETGVFTWRQRPRSHFKNDRYWRAWHSYYGNGPPGGLNDQGYLLIRIAGSQRRAHRLAFLYMLGRMPKGEVDHINHDRADNRWSNLREIPKPENQRNMSLNKRNKSGICGVSWDKRTSSWAANIGTGKQYRHLGRYKDIEKAAEVRAMAEKEMNFHQNHGAVK